MSLFAVIAFNMTKVLAKVKAGKTITEESHKVTNRLIWTQFYNFYRRKKIKLLLLRLIVVRFRFCKKRSGISIIDSLTCKISEAAVQRCSLRKGVLKICSKFTGEHPCRSAISIKLTINSMFDTSRIK